MWKNLPEEERNEYKKMILAFASLTEMFAQKADGDDAEISLSPIINSKYQETVFQKAFHASAEDIGNTSYDAGIKHVDADGKETKYLIGIKTFGVSSGAQKIAQFKAYHDQWSALINKMRENSIDAMGNLKTKEQIDADNESLYMELARSVAHLRNKRISSAESNIQGFSIALDDDCVESVYHVLMPSKKGDKPTIYVGETSYDKIDEENISIIGCTGSKNPTNFSFFDGNHTYKYTSADSQLYMDFKNKDIVEETWDVVYAEDAYSLFSNLSNQLYGEKQDAEEITESYSWMITNKKDEVELFSGFNSFYAVGSKLSVDSRDRRIEKIVSDYKGVIDQSIISEVKEMLQKFLKIKAPNAEEKKAKAKARNTLMCLVSETGNMDFIEEIEGLVYRPYNEMYIPIPNAKAFHLEHPDFFGDNIGSFKEDGKTLALDPKQREFTLVFEPSGDSLKAFITQDQGKAIESTEKQSYLGEWILRGIFQLEVYEPLTAEKLNEVGINGIRLYKTNKSNDVHLQFIWIDKDNLPEDYIK